jgi:RNA polymerase sigma-70 factor (ECF subfamily)
LTISEARAWRRQWLARSKERAWRHPEIAKPHESLHQVNGSGDWANYYTPRLSMGLCTGSARREEVRARMGERLIDQELVVRVQQGDKKAFDLLVLKYQQKITNLISRYIRDPHEVLDVTQEAFIKAYRAIPKFRGDSAFYTWLYRIAINTAKNYLVAQGRRPPTDDVEAETAEQMDVGVRLKETGTPENHVLTEEISMTVQKAIDDLPEDLRTAIILRELEGMSYEEIANAMSCPVGTVRSRIFRARKTIDKKLNPLLKP